MKRSLFFVLLGLLCSLSLLSAAEHQVIPLWPNGAPGSEAHAGEPEKFIDRGDSITRVTNIHNPSITVFLPPANRSTGVGVVLAPGGGHEYLAVSIEGYEVAEWLNSHGIAAFVLKYRLSRAEGSTYTVEGQSLKDAQRAIRLVRSHAREWNVDPGRLGIMGFSAGGSLVGLAGTRFDFGNLTADDLVERYSSRPDFLVFVYGASQATKENITASTPPSFLVSAADDPRPTAGNLMLFSALQEAGVPSELHIFMHGGHGFGFLGRSHEFLESPVGKWPDLLMAWLTDLGVMER